jgi:cytochrome P450/predicted ester cyclase
MTDDPRSCVLHYYKALNGRDFDALDSLVVPDLIRHEPGAAPGLAALKETIRLYQVGFPDLTHELELVVVDAGLVAVRTITTGTQVGPFLGHLPGGQRFSAAGQSIYRVEGGMIRELWGVFDTLSMLQQLGLYTPTMDRDRPFTSPRPATTTGQAGQPPGPRHELSVAEVRSNPLEFLLRLIGDYGDVVRYVCNGRVTILLNTPEAVRCVLHDRASNYSKLATPDMLLLQPMLGEGLLTTEGDRWKADRQWIQPLFSHRLIERWGLTMVRVAEEIILRWDARRDRSAPIDVPREMSRLTLEIAARALLSTDLASQSEAFGRAMDVLNESMGHVEPDSPSVQDRFRPALMTIRTVVWQTILGRKLYDTGEDDLVALLLRAQRQRGDDEGRIVDQAVTMLLAGHETTAKTLTWVFALLDQHADVSARLLVEHERCLAGRSPTIDDLPALAWTRAVIHETLRLYPPVWSLTRTALAQDEILGYDVPAGALVSLSPYLLHRHHAFWDRADTFSPERFLGDEAELAARACRYLPFGYGPRQCIGKHFALLELALVLATIHPRLRFMRPSGPPPEPEALVTLRPRGGLWMIMSDRATSGCPTSADLHS